MTFHQSNSSDTDTDVRAFAPYAPTPLPELTKAPQVLEPHAPIPRSTLAFYIYCVVSLIFLVFAAIYEVWPGPHPGIMAGACVLDIAIGASWFAVLRYRKKKFSGEK